MNPLSTLKHLMLSRHREDLRSQAGSSSFFSSMAHTDEKWLMEASEEEITELSNRSFPLYRIACNFELMDAQPAPLSPTQQVNPVEWIMTTFFCELKSSLMQQRARTMFDWGMTPATAQWLLSASPLAIAAALRSKHLSIKASQGRNGFATCLQSRRVSENYLHLLRGISTPVSDLGHASRLSFN